MSTRYLLCSSDRSEHEIQVSCPAGFSFLFFLGGRVGGGDDDNDKWQYLQRFTASAQIERRWSDGSAPVGHRLQGVGRFPIAVCWRTGASPAPTTCLVVAAISTQQRATGQLFFFRARVSLIFAFHDWTCLQFVIAFLSPSIGISSPLFVLPLPSFWHVCLCFDNKSSSVLNARQLSIFYVYNVYIYAYKTQIVYLMSLHGH